MTAATLTAKSSAAPEPVLAEAEAFVRALAGRHDAAVTFQTFDDTRSKRAALARVLHGTLAQHWRELVRLNLAGAGVFVMVNEGDGRGRTAANVLGLRALFLDDDAGDLTLDALGLTPSLVVQSRNGLHVYWRLRRGEPVADFTRAQAAIAAHLRTDSTVKDPPRVMRVAGFLHVKDPAAPFLVRVVQAAPDVAYTIAEVLEGLGAEPVPEAPAPSSASTVLEHGAGAVGRARAYLAKVPPAIEGERGDALTYRVAATLVRDFGLSVDAAMPVLSEWNATCSPPWSDEELRDKLEHGVRYGRLAPGAKLAARPLKVDSQQPERRWPLTDAGNAERFAVENRTDVRYVHGWERWLIWDGSRFRPDERREVYRLGIANARRVLVDAAREGVSQDEARAITKHALASERRDRIEASLALARTIPPLAVTPDDLDRNPYLLNVQNGTIDLRTGALLRHDRAHLSTKCCPVAYDPTAEAPTWLAFQARITPDPAVRAYKQRAIGYSLTGDVGEQCLFFGHGGGANGKSTELETVRELLGEGEYAKAAAPDLLLAKRSDRHAVELADLRGARFVTTIEVGEGRAWDEARVKWLTGGDAISARFMYGNPFTFQATHKFWIAANHKPRVAGTDLGFWRRVHFIPYPVTIPKEEQDPNLRAKLREELPGILRWAVEGCLAWRRDGLRPPAAVLAATAAYRSGEDVLAAFLEEACVLEPSGRVAGGALYATFRAWAERNGERVMTSRAFGDALEDRGFDRVKSNGQRWFAGLHLRTAAGGAE